MWCLRRKNKDFCEISPPSSLWRQRLVGLGVWFSLRVREVPGSIPGRAQYLLWDPCTLFVVKCEQLQKGHFIVSYCSRYSFLDQSRNHQLLEKTSYLFKLAFFTREVVILLLVMQCNIRHAVWRWCSLRYNLDFLHNRSSLSKSIISLR